MAEFETGPKPLDPRLIARNRLLLRLGEIPADQKRDFTLIGTFKLGVTGDYNKGTLWTQILLDEDPTFCRLRISEHGTILLLDQQNNLLRAPILAPDLRIVDVVHSGLAVVRESGYLLQRSYVLFGGGKVRGDQMERFLINQEEGQETAASYPYPFARVDKSLVGQKLWLLIFDLLPSHTYGDEDAVVIDPKSRKMIEREITRPLVQTGNIEPPLIVDGRDIIGL